MTIEVKIGIAYLCVVLVAIGGCSAPRKLPNELVRHWISQSNPKWSGLKLNADGSGRFAGTTTDVGAPFRWEVRGDKLRLEAYGEEGEHFGFTEYHYYLSEDRLTVIPPIKEETLFVDQNYKR